MISDHNGSDRNNDGWDSPHIWDDFAGSTGNVFGIIADTVDVSPTVTTLPSLPGDSCLHGPLGTVTGIKYHEGTTFTIYPAVNPTVVGIAYNSGTSGDLGVLAGHAYYGRGKVAFIGDSSPLDDGTGNPASTLANSYTADVNGSHRILLVNTTVWLAASDSSGASGTLSITTNGSTTICPGQPITLTANGGSSYTWSPGGDTTASITVSPATNTTYSVSGIVNGSNQSRSITVNITPLPTPAFTATVTGMDVSFGNQSQNATTSTWNFGDGSAQVSSSTPLHIYTQNGTYTVLLITTNSCGSDTLSKKVVVGSNGISAIAQDDAVKVILLGSDQIKVSYPDSYDGDRSISVYSMTGQEVIKIMSDNGEGSRLVNIQNLLSGVYFLKAGSLVKKFIR
jgi:PKD repeat protein